MMLTKILFLIIINFKLSLFEILVQEGLKSQGQFLHVIILTIRAIYYGMHSTNCRKALVLKNMKHGYKG